MRDIALARKQFFGGLFCLLGALVTANFVLMPQWRIYQANSEALKNPASHKPRALESLPVISENLPETWRKRVVSPLYDEGTKANVIVESLEGAPGDAEKADKIAPGVKKIPVEIIVKGSYFGVQRYAEFILKRFPHTEIASIELKNTNPSKNPGESPILEGTLHLQMYTFQH